MSGNSATEASIDVDPEQLFEDERVESEERTYTHGTDDHCEADAAGRAVVGVTDADGRVLLAVSPDEEHAILANETVAPGEDWAAVGREHVAGMTGLDVTLDDPACVERVRRVEHVVEADDEGGENDESDEEPHPHVTHHVVFRASVAGSRPTLDGLCDDNPWELRWCEEVPVEMDDDGSGVLDDVALFLDAEGSA